MPMIAGGLPQLKPQTQVVSARQVSPGLLAKSIDTTGLATGTGLEGATKLQTSNKPPEKPVAARLEAPPVYDPRQQDTGVKADISVFANLSLTASQAYKANAP